MPVHGVTVAGNPGAIRVSEGYEGGVFSGLEYRAQWKGERVAMFSAFPALANGAIRASIRQEGAVATAEITVRDLGTIVDTVEIDFNSVTRDWFTCPAYSTLTQLEIRLLLGKLMELQKYAEDGNTPTAIATKQAAIMAELGTALGTIYEDLVLNGLSYQALLPVITFTRSVSSFIGDPFIIVDMGKVFSTAAMNANVPLNPQFAVSEVTNTIAANSRQTLGWLKSGRYGVSSDGSVQYVQTYTFDSYPTARYTFVS